MFRQPHCEDKATLVAETHNIDIDDVFGHLMMLEDSGFDFDSSDYVAEKYDLSRKEAHALIAFYMSSFRHV